MFTLNYSNKQHYMYFRYQSQTHFISFRHRMDHEETWCRLVVDERSATLAPHRRSSLLTSSRYVQSRSKRQVSHVTADTSSIGAIIGGGSVVAAAGPAMRRWARRGCCYPSTPDQRWDNFGFLIEYYWPYMRLYFFFFFINWEDFDLVFNF